MSSNYRDCVILMADDDPADILLTRRAFEDAKLNNTLRTVPDGVELLSYLNGEGDYSNRKKHPYPDIVLLDLNMPKMDGRTALEKIRSNPGHRRLPVIILTTSSAESDVLSAYDTGANSYITKPVDFDQLVEAVSSLERYWFRLVTLPTPNG
ncbi:response regulator [Alphaproteobacteria bacterium HT1-32]|nr:response regulator [Alphaproteobacteria bacterium HT1-32]